MKVKSAVFKGCERLTDDELSFLILVGQLSNELTALHKILKVSNRIFEDKHIQSANGVVIGMLEKLLASKLWQGWEMVRQVFHGKSVSASDWLRGNSTLTQHLRQMRQHFPDGCRYETIRNQFGFHYDPKAIAENVRPAIIENGFLMLFGEKVENTFCLTSEVVTWTTLVGQDERDEYRADYAALLKDLYKRTEDFIRFFLLVIEAFSARVQELGGEVELLEEIDVDAVKTSDKIVLPLFVA
jgi:hypothetical protein